MALRKNFGRRSSGQAPEACRDLLPWYLNNRLTPPEQEAVEAWLRAEPGAKAELAAWGEIQEVLASQPRMTPSPRVWQGITAQVSQAPARRQAAPLARLAWGLAVALAVLAVLWTVLQPGIVLQWSAAGGPSAAFRVYRAPVGSGDVELQGNSLAVAEQLHFGLVGEVPAEARAADYRYVDARPWLARAYVYRIEALGRGGQPLASHAIAATVLEALPAQVAVLLASLMAGCGAAALAGGQRAWRVAWAR
jgi:hypothetical protein